MQLIKLENPFFCENPEQFCPVRVVDEADEALSCLLEADLIVGLHPDGAAEALVDWGLKTAKPFALIPCCTCSKDFPKRKLNGKLVRSYEDLLTYLMGKNSEIKKENLDFEGKNTVLWWKPPEETGIKSY